MDRLGRIGPYAARHAGCYNSHAMNSNKTPPRPEINSAGLGVTAGDWQIGGIPVSSTDDRYDTAQAREAAERAEYNASEARRHGDKMPNPVMDMLKPRVQQDLTDDPVMRSVELAEAPKEAPPDPASAKGPAPHPDLFRIDDCT